MITIVSILMMGATVFALTAAILMVYDLKNNNIMAKLGFAFSITAACGCLLSGIYIIQGLG